MNAILEKVKNLFTNYEDEDYVSDLIIEDDEFEDMNYAEDLDSQYEMKTFTEEVSGLENINDVKERKLVPRKVNVADMEPRLVNFDEMNTQKIVLVRPDSLEDGQVVANQIKAGKICVVNCEETDSRLAQRILDFLTGSTYSLGGAVSAISDLIFVVSPFNVMVTEETDDSRLMRDYHDARDVKSVLSSL